MNITDLVAKHARRQPDAPAIIEGARTLTYRDFDLAIGRLAAGITALGLREGDRIGICLKARSEFLALFLAIAKIGAVALLMDWRAGPHSRSELASTFDATLVVQEPDIPDIASAPCLAIDSLWQTVTAAPVPPLTSASGGGRPQAILRSSGTTGLPKGMVVTHDQWIARMTALASLKPRLPNERVFSAGALAFAFSISTSVETLCSGKTLILYPPLFTLDEFITAIERYRPDTAFLVSTLARRLLELAPADRLLLPGLRNLIIGGAALHASEKREIARHISPNLYDRLGTSGAGGISCLYPSEIFRYGETVGRVCPGVTAEVVDEEDRPAASGMIGRLRCRGPSVISGWAGPVREDDPEFLRDGWYYTSDLASFNTDGYLRIEGRAVDVINRGGAIVYATEVERVLLDHPAVCEAAVLGYPDTDLGEEIAAFVVLKAEIEVSHLTGHCRDRLAPYKVPRRMVICASLPKTSSGKLRKPDLADLLRGGGSDTARPATGR